MSFHCDVRVCCRHAGFYVLKNTGSAKLQALYFGGGSYQRQLRYGQRIDVAFHLTVNEFRGMRSVQLNLLDLRPVHVRELYDRFLAQQALDGTERRMLAPNRMDVTVVWRHLRKAVPVNGVLRCTLEELALTIADTVDSSHSIRRTAVCLDILQELGLLHIHCKYTNLELRILPEIRFNALENSSLYRALGGD